jgi:hypothetical protein
MKIKNESDIPAVRNKYSAPFKEQALERVDQSGIPQGGPGFRAYRIDVVFMVSKTSPNEVAIRRSKASTSRNGSSQTCKYSS